MSFSICCCKCFVLAIIFDMIGRMFSFSAISVTIFSLRISRMDRVLSTVINCCCNLDAKILAYLKDKELISRWSIELNVFFRITSVNVLSDVSAPMLHWKPQLECFERLPASHSHCSSHTCCSLRWSKTEKNSIDLTWTHVASLTETLAAMNWIEIVIPSHWKYLKMLNKPQKLHRLIDLDGTDYPRQ